MTAADIIFSVMPGQGGNVGKIYLNRPESLNALTLTMVIAIKEQLKQWEQDHTIKAVIIAGAGERAFCAGGDIRSFYNLVAKGNDPGAVHRFFQHEYTMNEAIFRFPKPYIAFLDGVTMGGGVGVSLHGSHSIATERLLWAMPETGIGFFPDIGAGYHLARLSGNVGEYLALTGDRLPASDAFHLHLVKAIVHSASLQDLEQQICATDFGPLDLSAVTRIITPFHQHRLENPQGLALNLPIIANCFSQDSVEAIITALQTTNNPWCEGVIKTLLTKSPTSLKVTLEHIRRCRQYNFQQVIAEDLQLSQHFLTAADFMEGIRAAVIDKDHHPHWQPASLREVEQANVQAYFSDSR